VPELPEVETVVREIRAELLNRSITAARFAVPRQLQPHTPRGLARAVAGQTIRDVRRRGKHILLQLDRGLLLVHLRMTGRLYVREAVGGERAHERAWFDLNDGRVLALRDARTLGVIRYVREGESPAMLNRLGWEPLFDRVCLEELKIVLSRRTIAVKPLLLDQKVWAGIGNIYASEILWEARINPRKRASRLTRSEMERLREWVPRVLKRALDRGGSTLRNFVSADGRGGSYQREFRVYGREGEPCPRCRAPVRRFVQAQRSTYFCPRCQNTK
jgi:formamidopyrimidine-DNA glycosylase